MVVKFNKIEWLQYVGFYLLAAFVGGSLLNLFLGVSELAVFAVLFGAFLLGIKRNVVIARWFFLYGLVLVFSFLITVVHTGGGLSLGTTGNYLCRYVLVYCLIAIDAAHFLERFLKFAFFIALASFCFYILAFLVGFSTVYALGMPIGGDIHSLIFFNCVPIHFGKNIGIFGEPGQYQIFLSVALYLCVCMENKLTEKQKRLYSIVYVLTMLSVNSTAGYMVLFGFFVVVLIRSQLALQVKTAIVAAGASFLGYVFFFIDKNTGLYYNVIGKILTDSKTIDLSQGSGSARTDSILGGLLYIQENVSVLWGIGYDPFQELGLESCASLIASLMTLGIVSWFLIQGMQIYLLWKYKKNVLYFCLGVYILLVAGLSQPNILNPMLLVLTFSNALIRRLDTNDRRLHECVCKTY